MKGSNFWRTECLLIVSLIFQSPGRWCRTPHERDRGIYLSFVPTVPQVQQTVAALQHAAVFAMVETFETLLRTWSVQGRSVRPDHRMVAHSGFLRWQESGAGFLVPWDYAVGSEDDGSAEENGKDET
jgi:tRNA (adenine57-N1/adenine58-N1)-methyltransferase